MDKTDNLEIIAKDSDYPLITQIISNVEKLNYLQWNSYIFYVYSWLW